MILYEHSMDRKVRDMKFSAILHGADPKELNDRETIATTNEKTLLFGDPAEYGNMSFEKRKELSDKMRGKFGRLQGGIGIPKVGAKEDA
jgi:hypothetical protein